MQTEGKYAKPEWERRFLLERIPAGAKIHGSRKIIDRYIAGTTLRLRRQIDDEHGNVSKLTQKIPTGRNGALQGAITTIYLTGHEHDVFAALAATVLTKTRYSVPPFGLDVFDGVLSGLVMAEVEFNSGAEACTYTPPSFVVHEVSSDHRFDGGSLAAASRHEVEAWVAEYGLILHATC
jgi:CYTH domain-containing protein